MAFLDRPDQRTWRAQHPSAVLMVLKMSGADRPGSRALLCQASCVTAVLIGQCSLLAAIFVDFVNAKSRGDYQQRGQIWICEESGTVIASVGLQQRCLERYNPNSVVETNM